jgi:hypothetical protein
MKTLTIRTIFLVASLCFAISAQTPKWSETDINFSRAYGDDLERKGIENLQNETNQLSPSYFKTVAKKDRIILRWAFDGTENKIGYRIYRSEYDQDSFVLISSSEHNKSDLPKSNRYYFNDLAIAPGITYWYKLVCTGENKKTMEYGPISASLPVQQSFPNKVVMTTPSKFRFEALSSETDQSTTTLRLDLPYQSHPHHPSKISIYGQKGEKVKTIYKGPMEAGSYQLIWSGDSEQGEMVNGGVFFAVFENDFVKEVTKLILIR